MMQSLQDIFSLKFLAHPAVFATLSLLVVLLFLYWCGTRGFEDLKKLNVPHVPKPVPFLGNFLDARKYNGMHLMYLDYAKKYGKVFAICLGAKPSLVVADPDLLKVILIKDFPNFRDHYIVRFPAAPFSKSVFHSQGDSWKRIRDILTPTFSSGKMRLMVPLMEKSCDTLMQKLENIADTGEAWDNNLSPNKNYFNRAMQYLYPFCFLS